MGDLKKKAVKGMFWSAIDSFGMYFVKFVFSIAIARLLSPEDYGLVGMLAIFMGFAFFMYEGGFTAALIHKKDADQTDFSTAFYFNILKNVLTYYICKLLIYNIQLNAQSFIKFC